MNKKNPCALILLGPTASGKSHLALKLAEEFKGTIINADSMQVYKNFPTLSAFPSREDFEKSPHRLYGVFDLEHGEQCSASKWAMQAKTEIQAALEQGRLPILVGGTGFYIKALLEGLSTIPDIPGSIRTFLWNSLENEKERFFLYSYLKKIDPETGDRIKMGDTQRLVRALEVFFYTKKPISFWNKQPQKPLLDLNFRIITLMPKREDLYANINQRSKKILEDGAIDEVEMFLKSEKNKETKVNTIGYREIQSYLAGEKTYPEMLEKLQQKTRNYAKRQMTWIRHQVRADLTIESIGKKP